MSLNDIRLNNFIVSELYKDTLVLIKEKGIDRKIESKLKSEDAGIKYLGGNQKRTAFIINHSPDAFFSDDQFDWFQKMLQACKLNMGDVAVLNISLIPINFNNVQNELKLTRVIFLGVSPEIAGLPFNMENFDIQNHKDCTYLSVPAISDLMTASREGKILKSKLWVCLQKLFDTE